VYSMGAAEKEDVLANVDEVAAELRALYLKRL